MGIRNFRFVPFGKVAGGAHNPTWGFVTDRVRVGFEGMAAS